MVPLTSATIPAVLRTPRLRLEPVADDTGPWCVRRIVRAFDDLAVGEIEFHGVPVVAGDGVTEIEVAVRLDPDARGHGAATEALRGVLGHTDGVGVRLLARTRPDHTAAVRMLATCGFTGLRGSDEDGNLVMVRPVPAPD